MRKKEKDRHKEGKKKLKNRHLPEISMPFAEEADNQKAAMFFDDLGRRIILPAAEKHAMMQDFANALKFYAASGLPADEALARLDPKNLGGFYSRPSNTWYPLDNAARIYPFSMRHDYMSVFRLSAYLKEDVVPEILQMALTFTIKRFPSFATTVKKGFFWHYLDATKRRYIVEPETGIPCQPIRIGRSGSQTFRVLFYRNRISVEYFHILTDGTGGMCFLKTLIAEYFRLLGVESACTDGVLPVNGLVSPNEVANEFLSIRSEGAASGFVDKSAVQFCGKLSRIRPCRVIHFKMDASALKAVAAGKGVTVTAYILSLMFVAARRATDRIDGEFSIQVPVNMRKFYPSGTLRNFSMYCGIRLPLAEISEPDALIPEIMRQLKEKASRQAMDEMVRATNRITNAIRFIPLFLKAPVARLVYGFLGDRIFSSTFSNLGVVSMPPEIAERIDSMDLVLGTAITNRAGCSMVTYGNTATLSVSKNTADPSFEEALYGLLCRDGLTPAVEGSELIAD
ncbi:MAG TPA: hypothetical protein PK127_04535 [Clostridiales bacterium]|nr:hypothetical protein [Clostridiales bacterium]HPV01726.1 hypothetical protein [Clostridiales bacterium]